MKANKILLGLVFLFGTFACGEDFLETQPTEFVSADQVADIAAYNPDVLAGNLSGIYANMYLPGTGGTTGHDDWGHKSYDVMGDFLSGDMVLGNTIYGWYSTFTQYLITTDYTFTDNYQFWRHYYRIINGANIILDGLGGDDVEPTTPEGGYVKAQALAMRAHGYFYLAQYFDEEYDPTSMLIPIYTNLSQPNQPLSPTQDVYNLIISDLTEAVDLLDGFNRTAKFEVNQDVAELMLAYAYAAMGENTNAAAAAKNVIDRGNFAMKTNAVTATISNLDGTPLDVTGLTNGNYDDTDPSWMWGTNVTADMGLGLVSWWGVMDLFSYSYTWAGDQKEVNFELYQAIPNDDYRKAQFFPLRRANGYVPLNKFYSPERQIGGASRTVTSDLLYMRIEEAYLLHAETAAKAGQENEARLSLRALMDNRVPDATYVDALTGQALLDEIILQTRIEFVAEGKSYLLKKRNGIDVVTGSNHIHLPSTVIPINSDEMTVEIPQLEIQNNPQISLGDVE